MRAMINIPYFCASRTKHGNRKNNEGNPLLLLEEKSSQESQKFYLVAGPGEELPKGHIFFSSAGRSTYDSEPDDDTTYEMLLKHKGQTLTAPAFGKELTRLIDADAIAVHPCQSCKHRMVCLVNCKADVTYEKV